MLFQAPGGVRLRWRVREPSLRRFRADGQERLRVDLDRICRRPAPRGDSCGSECSCASFFHLCFRGFNLDERVEGVNGFCWLVQERDGVWVSVRCVEHGLYGLPEAAEAAEGMVYCGSFIAAVNHAIRAFGISGLGTVILPFG